MPTVTAKTAAGVYTSISDQSFTQTPTSRFRAGLVGVATKGPFNVPTRVRSLKEFRRLFGQPVGEGNFLADAVAVLADLSDGTVVVRVGSQYEDVSEPSGTGAVGSYQVFTPQAALFNPANFSDDPADNLYVKITQTGKLSTVNAVVDQVFPLAIPPYITLQQPPAPADAPDFPALADTYTGAEMAFSTVSGAANAAESTLYGYEYGAAPAGIVIGSKNAYSFTTNIAMGNIDIGGVYKIGGQDGRADTNEVRVKSILETSPLITVQLEPANMSETGYQALALQDSYTSGTLYPVASKVNSLFLRAASAGTWANSSSADTGLYVKVLPGSKAGTKKMEVYEDAALVETFDNLAELTTSEDAYETRINDISQYITVEYADDPFVHPANTANGWNTTLDENSTPMGMPFGAINQGGADGVDGSFKNGFNGATASDSDFIGTVDPTDDSTSGIKAFEDVENVQVDIIYAPGKTSIETTGETTAIGVHQELTRVANKVNAIGLIDVPDELNTRAATDWHNGAGVYTGRGRLDTRNGAVFWNWFRATDRFATDTSTTKWLPPGIGALRCLAFTFDQFKPWFAAAGATRGLIPEALELRYPRTSIDARAAMYGDGNSVNPIIFKDGQIMLYGERTLQRAESKLTAIHSVVLVHTVVGGLAEVGGRFVFDPNDVELLRHIELSFAEYLDKIKNERGLEAYRLIVDSSNNPPESRNRREVIVDLAIIPTDTVERIYINATVRESGANLNAVTTG